MMKKDQSLNCQSFEELLVHPCLDLQLYLLVKQWRWQSVLSQTVTSMVQLAVEYLVSIAVMTALALYLRSMIQHLQYSHSKLTLFHNLYFLFNMHCQ